jgi:hypothetical protein
VPQDDREWALYLEALLAEIEPSRQAQEAQYEESPNGFYYGKVTSICRACGSYHSISLCPLVFKDTPHHLRFDRISKRAATKFHKRMAEDPEFHEGVMYVRKKFAARTNLGFLAARMYGDTQDAPPLVRSENRFSLSF